MKRLSLLSPLVLALAIPAVLCAQPVTMPTAKTAAGQTISATPVVPLDGAGAGTVPYGSRATSTMADTTVTAGGTFQTVLTASSTRKGCTIQNPIAAPGTLFVFFGASGQTTAKSVELAPGAQVSCNSQGVVLTDLVQVTSATTGHAFKYNSF